MTDELNIKWLLTMQDTAKASVKNVVWFFHMHRKGNNGTQAHTLAFSSLWDTQVEGPRRKLEIWSRNSDEWYALEQWFPTCALGSNPSLPRSPWDILGNSQSQNYFHGTATTLPAIFTLILSQISRRIFQRVNDVCDIAIN